MRKIKAFSAKMSTNIEPTRSTFSKTIDAKPSGEISVFMTPSLIKMNIREMKRSINIRFLQLVKSCKAFAKNTKDAEDLMYLRKYMVKELTMMLGEYVDSMQSTPSLQLVNYLKVSSVAPQAVESAKVLSRVMIIANKLKKSSGTLPPKNQRDLNRAMDNFISDVIEVSMSSLSPNNPLTNEQLQV